MGNELTIREMLLSRLNELSSHWTNGYISRNSFDFRRSEIMNLNEMFFAHGIIDEESFNSVRETVAKIRPAPTRPRTEIVREPVIANGRN